MYLSIAGLIGAGKSTINEKLSEKLGYKPFYESVDDNPYLDDFYKDQYKYGTIMQFKMLSNRFMQQIEILHYCDWHKGATQDRTIYEDMAFARLLKKYGMINNRDFETYIEMFNIITHQLTPPDIILYLRVSPEISLKRIKERNRNMENTITLEYLKDLEIEYNILLKELKKYSDLLIVDGENSVDTILYNTIKLLGIYESTKHNSYK